MQFGSLHQPAHDLRVNDWIDAEGKDTKPIRLADLGDGYKILYCFQHWCPGCHSRGFPTLRKLQDGLRHTNVGFAVMQTVFEGSWVNTRDKLRENQKQYGLKMPFGHDVRQEGEDYPTFMQDYRSGGTPWFTVIDPTGTVIYADFRLDADRFLAALDQEDIHMTKN